MLTVRSLATILGALAAGVEKTAAENPAVLAQLAQYKQSPSSVIPSPETAKGMLNLAVPSSRMWPPKAVQAEQTVRGSQFLRNWSTSPQQNPNTYSNILANTWGRSPIQLPSQDPRTQVRMPALWKALTMQETRGNPTATSELGARGIGQIMPRGVLAEINKQPGEKYAPEDLYSPEVSLDVFRRHFAQVAPQLGTGNAAVKQFLMRWYGGPTGPAHPQRTPATGKGPSIGEYANQGLARYLHAVQLEQQAQRPALDYRRWIPGQ